MTVNVFNFSRYGKMPPNSCALCHHTLCQTVVCFDPYHIPALRPREENSDSYNQCSLRNRESFSQIKKLIKLNVCPLQTKCFLLYVISLSLLFVSMFITLFALSIFLHLHLTTTLTDPSSFQHLKCSESP